MEKGTVKPEPKTAFRAQLAEFDFLRVDLGPLEKGAVLWISKDPKDRCRGLLATYARSADFDRTPLSDEEVEEMWSEWRATGLVRISARYRKMFERRLKKWREE